MARFQNKISGPSWRSSASRLLTKPSVVGRLTRDTSRVQLVRPGRIRSNLKTHPQAQKRARDDPGVPHGPSGWPSPLASTADSPTFSEKVGIAGRRVLEACAAGRWRYAL